MLEKKYSHSNPERVFNFYPGPSTLPIEVIDTIKNNLYNWKNLGLNPMEIGHRTPSFIELYHSIIEKIRQIMAINQDYEVLLMHGGATAQYAAIPMNLLADHPFASYVITGHWAKKACDEFIAIFGKQKLEIAAQKEKIPNQGRSAQELPSQKLPQFSDWQFSKKSAYLYFTDNETIDGLSYQNDPNQSLTPSEIHSLPPLVADFTSSLLTREIDINRYGLVFASAQKCLGIAGVTLVVIRKDLLNQASEITPSVLNYSKAQDKDSMLNTPNTFSWYVMDLILDWVLSKGGVKNLYQANQEKARKLYDFIDSSDFYYNQIDQKYRSMVNVCFNLEKKSLEADFVKKAENHGFVGLKGHREVGGLRVSMYNAMPIEAINQLLDFMKDYQASNA